MGWRVRSDLGDIKELMESIRKFGQLQAIVVSPTRNPEKFNIIAGARRLTACKKLGIKVMATVVEPLNQIDALDMQLAENVKRKDFDLIELARGLQKRKGLYEKKHPETKHGATTSGKSKDKIAQSEDREPAKRFTKEASESLGISERRTYEYLQMAELPQKYMDEIDQAETSKERNAKAQDALRQVRKENKKKNLLQKAREKASEQEDDPTKKVVIYLGDNRKHFKKLEEKSFDVILTDPPYDMSRKSLITHVNRKTIKSYFGNWDKLDVGWVLKAYPLLANGGQMLIFSPIEAVGDYKTVLEGLGMDWRGTIAWKKTNPGVVHRNVYLSSVEMICWATKGDKYHFEPWENCGAEEVHNLIEGPICSGRERLDHPTQKPEWLIKRLMQKHCNKYSQILDPFAGVGTTLAVAKKLDYQAVGIEKDDGYCGQAVLRLRAI